MNWIHKQCQMWLRLREIYVEKRTHLHFKKEEHSSQGVRDRRVVLLGCLAASERPYLQQQRVLADSLDGGEQVALQRDVRAFLPPQEHAVLIGQRGISRGINLD